MFQCAKKLAGDAFILCCRREEWAKVRNYYAGKLAKNVEIVHLQGAELARYYSSADLFILRESPELILEKKAKLPALAKKHSWTNRVLMVAEALCAKSPNRAGLGTA
jgi:hypothetical protein